MNEDDRVAMLRRVLGPPPSGVLGIGDDAATLAPDLVWTIDEQVEGVHFQRAWLSLEDIGFRSLMAAASDIAAMGGDPTCALAALVLPRGLSDADLEAIARGQAEAARVIGAPIVGGNLARGPALSIATTVLGRAPSPVLRSGARAGDVVLLAGDLGLAGAGLRALERGVDAPEAIAAWRRPRARFDAARAMRGRASAAMDISDGLAIDLARLAQSSAVKIVLDEGAVRAVSKTADIELALTGGEDYGLVCTASEHVFGFVPIGRVEIGEGVFLGARPLPPRGWDHFGA